MYDSFLSGPKGTPFRAVIPIGPVTTDWMTYAYNGPAHDVIWADLECTVSDSPASIGFATDSELASPGGVLKSDVTGDTRHWLLVLGVPENTPTTYGAHNLFIMLGSQNWGQVTTLEGTLTLYGIRRT